MTRKRSGRVFVQIAAYRDPELGPTLRDCLGQARYARDLRFGICWQRGDDERFPLRRDDARFRVDEVPWRDSQGLGWARSRISRLYEGEEYTLQLDSHHRFARHWDAALFDMVEQTGSPRPIISTYATAYAPNRLRAVETRDRRLYRMVADRFTDAGTILFRPHYVTCSERPMPARFVSGHFFFTVGRHCEDYRYDPGIYFAGDEISLSVRSFTLGYDLYRPGRTLVWHEYTREGRPKHWDDHTTERSLAGDVEAPWHERNSHSVERLGQLLGYGDRGIDLGRTGLGTARTLREYELFAGIDFRNRRLHPYTTAGYDPPNPADPEWQAGLTRDRAGEPTGSFARQAV